MKKKYGGSSKFKKGMKKVKRSGRPKGGKNKFTNLKNAFLEAFEELKGTEGLVKWAKRSNDNRTQFYKMTAKMLPKEIFIDTDNTPQKLPFLIQIANTPPNDSNDKEAKRKS